MSGSKQNKVKWIIYVQWMKVCTWYICLLTQWGITLQTFLLNIKFVNQKICKVYIERFIDIMSGLNQEYGWFIRNDRHSPPRVSCPRSLAKVDCKHKTIG